MTEEASHLGREAKALHQGLKESLKTRDPWDRDVESQRKNLRRQYLRLLLVHPFTKESRDAETQLWMQTSYSFISIYKQRLAALDRATQPAPRQQRHGGARQGGHGPVEYRKLLQRFRQFLAEEEKFWTQLVVRLRRSFALTEAQPALVALGILPAADTIPGISSASADAERPNQISTNRNHFQFPPEDATPPLGTPTAAEHASQLSILTKALVCLGDIARYREQFNEAGGRPKAGHEDTVPARRNTRSKRGDASGAQIPRSRNYDKASQCYEQARLLVPQEGNPSHQLAILASYQKDTFGSLYHYYHALCVRQPYDTASDNLGTVLNRTLEQWKARMKKEKEAGGTKETSTDKLAPRLRVEAFKENVTVLHALWRLRIEKMDTLSPRHAERTVEDFAGLVSDRVLPIDLISKVIVLMQGALWKHRMIRDTSESPPQRTGSSSAVESRILANLLGMHQALLEVGVEQLAEAPPEDAAGNNLAQRITATFRRTLPALRIASKWLRANFKYVMQSQDTGAEHAVLSAEITSAFWSAYTRFSTALNLHFPMEQLPVMTGPLEEDVEMRGFLPLKGFMIGEQRDPVGLDENSHASLPPQGGSQVHPNEEQLMRIADLISDARALAGMDNAPLVLRQAGLANISLPSGQSLGFGGRDAEFDRMHEQEDDTLTEATSHDDPVGDAFRKALNGDHDVEEEDEQEDEIVWNPGLSLSPLTAPIIPTTLPSPPHHIRPLSPSYANFSPMLSATNSPAQAKATQTPTHARRRSSITPAVVPPGTTAQDLLNSVMGVPRTPAVHNRQTSSAPQPPLLFGSGPPNDPGHSIWSTSLDDDSLNLQGVAAAAATGNQTRQNYPGSAYPTSPSVDLSSTWSSHFSRATAGIQTSSASHSPLSPPVINPRPIGHQLPSSGQAQLSSSPRSQQSLHLMHGASAYSMSPQFRHIRAQSNLPPLQSDAAIVSAPASGLTYNPDLHRCHQDPRMTHRFTSHALWGSIG